MTGKNILLWESVTSRKKTSSLSIIVSLTKIVDNINDLETQEILLKY